MALAGGKPTGPAAATRAQTFVHRRCTGQGLGQAAGQGGFAHLFRPGEEVGMARAAGQHSRPEQVLGPFVPVGAQAVSVAHGSHCTISSAKLLNFS